MNKITEQIWIGNYADSRDYKAMREAGITAILNVACEVCTDNLEPNLFRYAKVNLDDDQYNPAYMKEMAVNILKQFLFNKEKVLVHCGAGISRSVWVVCRTLADIEGRSPRDVLENTVQPHRQIAYYGPLFAA